MFSLSCAGQTYRQRHRAPPSGPRQGPGHTTLPHPFLSSVSGALSALSSKGKLQPQGAHVGQKPPSRDPTALVDKGQPCSKRGGPPLFLRVLLPPPQLSPPQIQEAPCHFPLTLHFCPPLHLLPTAVTCVLCCPSPRCRGGQAQAGAKARHQERPSPPQQHSPIRLPGCEVGQVLVREETCVRARGASPKGSRKTGGRGRKMGERRGGRRGEGT